jgi:hypothetical protein
LSLALAFLILFARRCSVGVVDGDAGLLVSEFVNARVWHLRACVRYYKPGFVMHPVGASESVRKFEA